MSSKLTQTSCCEFLPIVGGILTSKGGGTTMTKELPGGLPYGEVALSAAANEGADVCIVNSSMSTAGEILWVTMPNSLVRAYCPMT